MLSEVTSGLTLGFFSPVKVDYFLLGCVTTVTHAECQPAPVQVMFEISGYKPIRSISSFGK